MLGLGTCSGSCTNLRRGNPTVSVDCCLTTRGASLIVRSHPVHPPDCFPGGRCWPDAVTNRNQAGPQGPAYSIVSTESFRVVKARCRHVGHLGFAGLDDSGHRLVGKPVALVHTALTREWPKLRVAANPRVSTEQRLFSPCRSRHRCARSPPGATRRTHLFDHRSDGVIRGSFTLVGSLMASSKRNSHEHSW